MLHIFWTTQTQKQNKTNPPHTQKPQQQQKPPTHYILCKSKLHTRKTHAVQSCLLHKTTNPTAIPPNKAVLNTN